MKPQTKKSLKQERLEKEEKRRKELENLNKNLIKKLYSDLFQMNPDLYHEYDFTFETFLYDYYKEIENNLDFDNPNYEQLLKKLDLKIKAKFNEENKLSYDLNGRQLKYELNKLNQDDDWALIFNYKKALFEEEEREKKAKKEQKTKEYFNDLDNQINIRKNYVDPVEKKKKEIYDYDEREMNEKLKIQQIENQGRIDNIRKNLINDIGIKNEYLTELENQNLLLNHDNKDLINEKISFLESLNNEQSKKNDYPIEEIQNILFETDLDKIKNKISTMQYKKLLRNQMDDNVKRIERPNKMSVEERKINKDLLKAAREYFKTHH
jgi:hypothetical protein